MARPGRPSNATLADLRATIADQQRTIERLRKRRARDITEPISDGISDWEPACMEPEELADWRAFNRTAGPNDRARRPCDDCPMSFALEMFAARRCNGIPGTDD